jgi:hypothetical protein
MAATGRKRGQSAPDWAITFEDASRLRMVSDALTNVTAHVSFKVATREGKHYLEVDSADIGMMCIVSARLLLDRVDFPGGEAEGDFSFSVDCKLVSLAVDLQSCSHLALTMAKHSQRSIPYLSLMMHDPDQHAHEACSEIKLLDDDESDTPLPMEFDLLVEVDLTVLREMIKKARKTHTEHLRIRIYLQDVGPKKLSTVVFSIDGDFKHEQKFCHETARDEDGSTIVRAATDGTHRLLDTDATAPAFEGAYPAEKIDGFVKNLPCRMLTAKVKTGMPLMLEYSLGSSGDEGSHIRFLVAPVIEE